MDRSLFNYSGSLYGNKIMKKLYLLPLILSFIFYFSGIGFDLPFLKVVSDEDSYVGRIVDMAEKGIWNPKWFFYPPLYFYFVAITAIFIKFISSAFIYFIGARDVITGLLSSYPSFVLYALWGRFISALFGFLSCFLVYKIVKEEFKDELSSHLSFILMAISPPLILHSHYAKPDSMQIFLVVITFFLSLKIYKSGGILPTIFGGILTAGAFMTKYSGGIIGVTVAISIILRFFEKRDSLKIFLRNASLCFISFIVFIPIFSPFTILDFSTFRRDFSLQAILYQIDPLILSENAWIRQIINIKNLMGVLPTLFLIFGLWICLKRSTTGNFNYMLLLSFPLIFYMQLGLTNQWVERHFLPALPFFIIIASLGFSSFMALFKEKRKDYFLIIWAILLSIQPLSGSLNYFFLFHQKDSRHLNREWVERNIPEGIYFAFEERTGLSPSIFGRLYYSFGGANFEGFLDSPFEVLFVSEGIKAQYIEGKKKEKFPRHFRAYRWIEDNSYLIRVIGKRGYDRKPKIFLYKLKGKGLKDGASFEIELKARNRGGNTFLVMISKKVLFKVNPNSDFAQKKKFNFKGEILPLFVFTPVNHDGEGKDKSGIFSYNLKIFDEKGELIDSIKGETHPNLPSIYSVKIENEKHSNF